MAIDSDIDTPDSGEQDSGSSLPQENAPPSESPTKNIRQKSAEKVKQAREVVHKAKDTAKVVRLAATAGRAGATGGATLVAEGVLALRKPENRQKLIYIIIIAVFLILCIFIPFIILMAMAAQAQSDANNGPKLTITKSGPETVPNSTNLQYTIDVSYSGTAEDIIITDPFPANATFFSASGNYTKQANAIVWSAKDNGVATPAGTGGGTSAACGQKSTPQTPPPLSCSGTNKTPVASGYYQPTNFGCNTGFPKDPNDNCLPACSGIPECSGVSGQACEEKVKWYSANADEYGCNAVLKVTNPTTGKAVIVRAIDKGPACSVQTAGARFDMSQAAYQSIGANGTVKVEKVDSKTPLGPVTSCTGTTNPAPGQSTATTSLFTFSPLKLTIVFKPTQADNYVVNIATGTVVGAASTQPPGGTGGGVSGGFVPPAANDSCNNKYASLIAKNSLLKKNFGDPACTYTMAKQLTMLKQQDPKFANLWYFTITPGESGYNPNVWASPAIGTPDSHGAWGLYQMGSSQPPGLAPPAPGSNGEYDRGDVNWELQTSNAIQYNTKKLHCSFRYWSTARSVWGKYSC